MWQLSIKAVLFLALLNLDNLCWRGNARSYLVENSEKPTWKSKPVNEEMEYHECYITVQETRRIGGQCVKIRENFQGCVAGSFMDPFHKDCL